MFLSAKHWHLFLLTFGIPIIFQFVMMGIIFASFGSGNEPDPSTMFSFIYVFPILMIIFSGTLLGWFWSVAIGLQSKVPANVKMKVGMFKTFFFIPIAYMLAFFVGITVLVNGLSSMTAAGEEPSPAIMFGSMILLVPLHLFAMFCMFYCMYFVAKTFKTAELQREATFSDFLGEFFLVWFYPIGVWILQPKINKMVDEARSMGS